MPEILLVEDTEVLRGLKTASLRDAGFTVEGVTDGEKALQALAKGSKPDVIISDLNQRGFEGYDLVHVLRGCFKVGLLTYSAQLRQRFEPRIEIARQYAEGGPYAQVPAQHKKTPLILTSSGPLPKEWPWRKAPSAYEWERENAEILHYTKALSLADKFFVVEPVGEPIFAIRGMDEVIAFTRERISRAI